MSSAQDDRDDLRVICLVRSGRRDAFATLVRRYQLPVLILARNILGDHHEAEDVAQDAFVDAYRHLDQFQESRSAFSTWLLTIVRNRCLKAMRKTRPVSVAVIPEAADEQLPEDNVSLEEIKSRLDAALVTVHRKTASGTC